MVLEKTLESPLDNKEVKPVNSKRNQPWIFIGRKEVLKLKLQYFGHLMQRADALEKTLMLGKIESRRAGRQDEMVGWHHWLNGHEFEQTQEDGEGQGSPDAAVHGVTKSQTQLSDWTAIGMRRIREVEGIVWGQGDDESHDGDMVQGAWLQQSVCTRNLQEMRFNTEDLKASPKAKRNPWSFIKASANDTQLRMPCNHFTKCMYMKASCCTA